jgi:hypothetical protein
VIRRFGRYPMLELIVKMTTTRSAGERCAMVLVIAGAAVVWSGAAWLAVTFIWS